MMPKFHNGGAEQKNMRRGLFIFAALIAAALCTWLVMRHRGPYEPVYNGKPLGYWLNLEAHAASMDDHIAAEAAFRSLGTNAVPFLVARLEHDATWDTRKAEFNAVVDKWHLPTSLKFSSTTVTKSSARALTFLGKSATPGFLRVFEDTSNTNALSAAAQALYSLQGYGRMSFDRPPGNWEQYVAQQKTTMSPAAWQRLSSAKVNRSTH